MKKLDHKNIGKDLSFSQAKKDIDNLIVELDQKHYLQRKVKFLLDIRGYLKVNEIKGSYVEFGSFKSEMQYSAFKILEGTGCMEKYIGLDSFEGEIRVSEKDKEHNLYESSRDFLCNYKSVKKFVSSEIGKSGHIIKGDFRKEKVQDKFRSIAGPISVAVLDCNFISSTSAALELLSEFAVPGCVLFFDDYFTNFRNGDPAIPSLIHEFFSAGPCCHLDEKKKNFSLLELGFYPPFAKSFLLVED